MRQTLHGWRHCTSAIQEASNNDAKVMSNLVFRVKERGDLQSIHEWPTLLCVIQQLYSKIALQQ